MRLLGELPSGGRAQATARRAVANNKANEVRLLGGAVVRGQNLDGQPVEIDSEYLLYNADTRLLTTDKPVVLTVGDSRTQAAGLAWNLDSRALELKPPVHATLQPRAQGLVSERVQAGPIAAAPRGNTGALTP